MHLFYRVFQAPAAFAPAALASLALAACAGARPAPAVNVTSADVLPAAPPSARAAAPAADDDTADAPASAPAGSDAPADASAKRDAPPPGQLVCRVRAPARTYEIYMEWRDDGGHGTLRTIDADGVVTAQLVTAQRADGITFVDNPGSEDLLEHVATLVAKGGATRVRMGRLAPWTTCD